MKVRSKGRYAYPGITRIFHERARLAILIALVRSVEGRSFSQLRSLCNLTGGNLGRHLQLLVEACILEEKTIREEGKIGRPATCYRLTDMGRQQFDEYLNEIERSIQDSRGTD